MPTKSARTCPNGHRYHKTSDCPVCPVCEGQRRPESGLLSVLSAPARRALERLGVTTAKDLSKHTEQEILALHGMGPSSIPKLKRALADAGLSFKRG